MASATQIASFIERIAPCAQKAYKKLGKVLPSICIGMACCECGYGTADSVKHHSYLGQKVGTGKTATKYWNGTFFNAKTSEEYQVGVHTTITAAFRSYESMEQCVFNYYELLNSSIYKGVTAGVDYKTQMAQIKACKYMTSSKEVATVISIIEKYGLTKYDGKAPAAPQMSENPYPQPKKLLRMGSKGNDVKWIQWELGRHGYKLTIDGIWGKKTEAAVRDFQSVKKLVCDGIVGPATIAALKS